MGEPQQLLRVLERQGASQNLALAVFTEEHVDFKKYQSGLSSLTVQRDRKDVGGVEYRGFEPKGTAVIVQAQEEVAVAVPAHLVDGVCHG